MDCASQGGFNMVTHPAGFARPAVGWTRSRTMHAVRRNATFMTQSSLTVLLMQLRGRWLNLWLGRLCHGTGASTPYILLFILPCSATCIMSCEARNDVLPILPIVSISAVPN